MSEISITRPDHLDYLEYHPSSHSLRDSEVLIIQDIGAESTFFSTGFNGYVTLYLSSHKRIILFSWNWSCHSSNESLVRALFMSLWKIIALLMIEDISILNNNNCCCSCGWLFAAFNVKALASILSQSSIYTISFSNIIKIFY